MLTTQEQVAAFCFIVNTIWRRAYCKLYTGNIRQKHWPSVCAGSAWHLSISCVLVCSVLSADINKPHLTRCGKWQVMPAASCLFRGSKWKEWVALLLCNQIGFFSRTTAILYTAPFWVLILSPHNVFPMCYTGLTDTHLYSSFSKTMFSNMKLKFMSCWKNRTSDSNSFSELAWCY